MRRFGSLVAVVLGLMGTLDAACGKPATVAVCGDGILDLDAGEECETSPGLRTFSVACTTPPMPGQRLSGCHPQSCTCSYCGDGQVDLDAGEVCDGDDILDATCSGSGTPRCSADCRRIDTSPCLDDVPRCGDGEIQLGEECDPARDRLAQAAETPCGLLESPFAEKPFTSGTSRTCQDCLWSRRNCNFCGDEVLDPALELQGETRTLPELCDGQEAIPEREIAYCRLKCAGSEHAKPTFECKWECDACQSFRDVTTELRDCCLVPGESCVDGVYPPCCTECVNGQCATRVE